MNTMMTRRETLKLAAAGVSLASLSGWMDVLATHAATAEPVRPGQRRYKSCVLCWMDGGPPQTDTFDMKPGHANAGLYRPIQTNVNGIQIGEHFPRLARLMDTAAIIRSMNTGVNDHDQGRIYMHTGYRRGVGGVQYPQIGSIVSAELGQPDFPLPNFVACGSPRENRSFLANPGYLGARHRPFIVADLNRGIENLRPWTATQQQFADRISVIERMDQSFNRTCQAPAAEAHRTMVARAVELLRSERSRAFDLSAEPAASAQPYGTSNFGKGCLLARRLVEVGVPFVEVYQREFDIHTANRAILMPQANGEVDQGMSALISDLRSRGLLDTTLIIWMGEFGRTPRVKADGGRDHFARAWSTVLFGGGIRGGQVIGRTSADGQNVEDRPVSAPDFMATVCRILGIDPNKEFSTSTGRPIRVVDRGANPIAQVL